MVAGLGALDGRAAQATFPGQVNKIVYEMSYGARFDADIYVLGADGHGRKQLTEGPEYDTHPSFSPDGGR